MNLSIKIGIVMAFVLSLSGCLKVDDDSNDDVAEALNQQNTLLAQQIELQRVAAIDAAPVTLYGTISNLSSGNPVLEASVTLSVGTTARLPVLFTGGQFEFDSVPAGSDFELYIESPTGTFLPRAFYFKSQDAQLNAQVFQDIGFLSVSEGTTHKFQVLDAVTQESITSLVFRASSSVGVSSRSVLREGHLSSYNAVTEQYAITLPLDIFVNVTSELDLDNDGETEYRVDDFGSMSNTTLIINSGELNNLESFELVDVDNSNLPGIELRISILDEFLNVVPGLSLTLDNTLNGELNATFDEVAGQYVLNVIVDNFEFGQILIPAFEVDGANYQSSSVSFSLQNVDFPQVRIFVNNSTGSSSYVFETTVSQIDVAVQPRAANNFANLSLIVGSTEIPEVSNSYKAFYSRAVELLSNSVSLVQQNVLQVTRGNDSPDDNVAAGTTTISVGDIDVGVTAVLSLNNTLLTVTPVAPLVDGFDYFYSIGFLKDVVADEITDVFGDSRLFTRALGNFNSSEIVLDNNNFTNAGIPIVATTTAGFANFATDSFGSAFLYFPTSIERLKLLTLKEVSRTRDNAVSASSNNELLIVRDSSVFVQEIFLVPTAANEAIQSSVFTERGATLADGRYYRVFVSGLLNRDSTSTSVTKIDYEYTLVTDAGIVETGTLELFLQ